MKALTAPRIVLATICLAIIACSTTADPLQVNRYRLRDGLDLPARNTLARAEARHHLHGAVSEDDRRARQGEYFTVRWDAPVNEAPLTLFFDYQQASTASRVLNRTVSLEAPRGKTTISIIGDDYAENGRILAWRMTLRGKSGVIDSEQSYLWQD